MATLYVCATPIGNLEDVSHRLLRVLREVDLIAAEDTRTTLKLLNAFEIRKPLTSFFRDNVRRKLPYLLKCLTSGQSIALVSEAGVPGISDPGAELVAAAHEQGIDVQVIPGPSAVTSALAISGFPADQFVFLGFLPAKRGKRKKVIKNMQSENRTIIFFESPHRLLATLTELSEILPERQFVVARELTKKFESLYRGSVKEVVQILGEQPPRGEYTLILGPR